MKEDESLSYFWLTIFGGMVAIIIAGFIVMVAGDYVLDRVREDMCVCPEVEGVVVSDYYVINGYLYRDDPLTERCVLVAPKYQLLGEVLLDDEGI